jgi:viroplasmin and RNaseH domain-containing protein
MPPQRTNMKFYSVANGVKIDVYTECSTCELNVNNFNHAVYKGFKTIDEAIYFLLSGNAYSSCKNIPVHEKDEIKIPTEYGHSCEGTCSTLNNETPVVIEEESLYQKLLLENVSTHVDSIEQTNVKETYNVEMSSNNQIDCEN